MSTRGTVINVGTRFVVEDCGECATLFALTEDLRNRRLEDHHLFYCPNGHSMSYSGKTDAQKAREQLAIAERRLANREDDLRIARMERDATERSLRATKGVLTKTRKRIEHGVCIHCNRSFVDLARHMGVKHAEVITP